MLRKITLSLFVVVWSLSSYAQVETQTQPVNEKKLPAITFEKNKVDFGDIPYEGNGTCEFPYKNTGKQPLLLSNVHASCGCTIPEWSKEPLKKGGKASIKVKYDTKRVGKFTKTITVTSNAKNATEVLTITGNVLPADAGNAPQKESPKSIKNEKKEIDKEPIK